MTSNSGAVLFDIDGTLVDSNYVHVDTWSRAFADAGVSVPSWKIHRCIGMDGDKLLETLVGSTDEAVALEAKDLHDDYYGEASSKLQILPGARELLQRIAGAGLAVVLATSAPEGELAYLRDLLDVEDIVSVVTSGDDAQVAKPQPEIVQVALKRAGVDPGNAVLIGDSVWDMKASRAAGVVCIGVRSGGIGEDELRAAGAEAVYEDPADIIEHLTESPISKLLNA